MEALHKRLPGARFFGLGGARMAALGFRPVVRAGLVFPEPLSELPASKAPRCRL